MEFTVDRIELTDMLGVNTYTFEPRLPPVAGGGADPVDGVALYAVKLVMDHQLLAAEAVSRIRMYCALCWENVAVSGEEVPVVDQTGVNFVPSLDTSTS